MNLENTKDLKLFFSEENLEFLKNINTELSKIENLIEKGQIKEEKYSLFINALTAKDFSNTNKEYFLDIQHTYSLIKQTQEDLKNLKNFLSRISTKLLSLVLNNCQPEETTHLINEINSNLNQYIELLEEIKKSFVANNISINTIDSYHSTKLLLTTFEMDLGEKLDETISLVSPNTTNKIDTSYSDIVGTTENKTLIISEKEQKVYLPYKKSELKAYMSQYPTSYYSYKNVIEKEFILPLDFFISNPSIARFRETYSLYRDREASSTFDAFKQAINLAFKSELNPAIIAACKTKKQLNNYLLCLSENKLDDFTDFEILYDINPQTAN